MIVDAEEIRILWCKMNDYRLEEVEPELVNYKCQHIDINRATLLDDQTPLVLNGLTLRNYRSYNEFYICRNCGKVYWQGTHWRRRITNQVLFSPVRDESSSDDDNNQNSDDNNNYKAEQNDNDDDDDGVVFFDAESN